MIKFRASARRRRHRPASSVEAAFDIVDRATPILREMGAELRRLDEHRRRLLIAEAAHRRDS